MCCTCNNGTVQKTRGGHLARLLLRPSPQNTADHGQVQFDMLFSSAPSWNESRFGRWQDVQLLVPRQVSSKPMIALLELTDVQGSEEVKEARQILQ